MKHLPAAILFDLDDTIIRAYARPVEAWGRLLARYRDTLANGVPGADVDAVRDAIVASANAFWKDPLEAARWRIDIAGARRLVVQGGFARLGHRDDDLAAEIADAFTEMRRAEYRLYPDAHDTLATLRQAGVKLALVTNGRGEVQRAKIERFDLARHFDHIQIEGEFGRGKPEPDVYHHALGRLGCSAREAWMVGDNVEWEVVTPQRLGLRGIWYDPDGDGLPEGSDVRPDRIIARLADLLIDETLPSRA
ncbi:MAG: HAD family hydrolase [Alphaproteobacteria bacterium]|nr:HAD family hydrolase [Alphaproteobacteria bacterium]MCW5741022.1 HAD family hydrolase [Alphaproteobacteria bacterium]